MSSIDIYSTQDLAYSQYFSCFDCNKHHLNRYLKFVEFVRQTPYPEDELTEEHHILPKSVFPEFENLRKYPWNSIRLSYRHHFIAHWILSNVFVSGIEKRNMHLAFWCMCFDSKERISSKIFERARKKMKEALKGRIMINKNGNIKYTHIDHLDFFIENGWILGRGTSIKIPDSWINDGKTNKRVFEEELQSYLDQGWIRGVTKDTKRNIGCVWVNNGKIVISVDKETASNRIAEGWAYGKLEGTIAKGLVTITNGTKTKRVKPEEVDAYFADGWREGHLNKPNKDRLYVNNGVECITLPREEAEKLISEGWKQGMLPRNKPKKTFINKDGKSLKILPEEIDGYITKGWEIGIGNARKKRSV